MCHVTISCKCALSEKNKHLKAAERRLVVKLNYITSLYLRIKDGEKVGWNGPSVNEQINLINRLMHITDQ